MTRRPGTAAGDDGIALLLTIFLMLLVASMSLVVGTVVLAEVKPTQFQEKSNRTLNAAEAGLDVALSRIRGAQNVKGEGVRTELPCTDTAGTVLDGPVAPGTRDSAYSVKIRYYVTDPSKQSASWRSSASNLITCVGTGPAAMPNYALLESTGTGTTLPGTGNTATRVLEQTYKFKLTNANIPGGRILNNLTPLCLSAEKHEAGAKVMVKTCDAAAADLLQKWAYTPELLLMTTAASGADYCVQADPVDGQVVRLTDSCDSLKATQLWSFNDVGRFAGATADATGAPTGATNGWCLTVANDKVSGSDVIMKKECTGTYDSQHTFNPEAAVGAGAASDASLQLVNFRYFGRCLDVTRKKTNATFLIGYPCKQAPSSSNVSWNQKFFWDGTTQQFCTDTTNAAITSCAATSSTRYCLRAGTATTPPVSGTRALLSTCTTTDASQKWIRRYKTSTTATSYNILTQVGELCLDLNPAGATEADEYDQQWGVVDVMTCDGSNRQKWNAPADLEDPATINVYEHDR